MMPQSNRYTLGNILGQRSRIHPLGRNSTNSNAQTAKKVQ